MKRTKNEKIISIQSEQNHFVIISHNIARNTKLSDSAKSLYIYLKSHSENFILSYRRIANHFNISEWKIKTAIKELKQSGFLQIEKKPNSNEYKYILLDNPTNEEYKIAEQLATNQLNFADIDNIIKILNNKRISKETREKINEKLQAILHAKWLD